MNFHHTLAEITGRKEDDSIPVGNLQLDSRAIVKGDIFFAMAEDLVAREKHIHQAVMAGAVAIVLDAEKSTEQAGNTQVIHLASAKAASGHIADSFYNQPSSRTIVIGITGTNGKTTCSHWLAQAWSRLSAPAATVGTLGCKLFRDGAADKLVHFDTGMTTPDVLSNHRLLDALCVHKASAVAMEVSSHALDQGRVDCIRFDTAIFTNLSRDHLDYHGDMASYGRAKQQLFCNPELRWAIINSDDAFGNQLKDIVREINSEVGVLTYGLTNPEADIGVERYEVTEHEVVAEIRTPWGRGALQSKYPGGYNLLNVLAVIGALCSHGMSLQSVLAAVSQLQAVPGRTQIVSTDADDVMVIIDYAHTPDALEKVLSAVRERCHKQLWCVFGCGGNRDQGKRSQMGAVASSHADNIVITSDNPRDENPVDIIDAVVAGCADKYVVEIDRGQAISHAIRFSESGDAIVIAGKGHEDYQEIAGSRIPFSDAMIAVDALRQRQVARAGAIAR